MSATEGAQAGGMSAGSISADGAQPGGMQTLRERKRAQTRERIVRAGVELFASKGYDETTVADIAAAADIGTRTFFGYFEGKDALLFAPGDDRIELAVRTIREAAPDEQPAQVLLRALDASATTPDDDLVSERAALRLRLVDSVAAVRARGALAQLEATKQIGAALLARFENLDAPQAAGLAGAFVGASSAVAQAVLLDPKATPAERAARIRAGVAAGLGVTG
ncbi:TetR/AcrR family transcriptional regulator [Humibacter soli]